MQNENTPTPASGNTGQTLRPYQERAIRQVYERWSDGGRSVCLVLPTGGGKTRIAEELIAGHKKTLFLVHRRELLRQARDRFARRFGRLDVGVIAPGFDLEPHARVQVATVQTLLARGTRPAIDLLIPDEFHHYVAAEFKKVTDYYRDVPVVGLTATPERQDGKPLGDIADSIVIGATYSELLRDGHLVDAIVYQPPTEIGSNELAADPLAAYERHGEGSRAFVFAASVPQAHELAARFAAAGYPARAIDGKQAKRDRDAAVADFSAGRLRVLCNYNVLTEGVDVPAARTVVLCRAFDHVGAYLQAVGRVARPHQDKPSSIVIDLTGATLRHGLPTEDREYSLTGDGITRTSLAPLRVCPSCGMTQVAASKTCVRCGFEFAIRERPPPRIYSMELRRVFAGEATPDDAKDREYKRLRALGQQRGWSLYYVRKSYKELFGILPVITDATTEEKAKEFARLAKLAAEKGYKSGFALARFKETFGEWPSMAVKRVEVTT